MPQTPVAATSGEHTRKNAAREERARFKASNLNTLELQTCSISYQMAYNLSVEQKEYINHEAGNSEAWICICNNTPDSDGFFSCDKDGNEVDPTHRDWKTNWYVCGRCGRIIDQASLGVVGQNQNFKRLA
ncbi:MAG: hypothetical protein ACYDGM_09620 [Vulcanimicrobiaceae bacterium]